MMQHFTKTTLEAIEAATDPRIAIHVAVHNLFDQHGYEATQLIVRDTIRKWPWGKRDFMSTQLYFQGFIWDNVRFERFKFDLLKHLAEPSLDQLKTWVLTMSSFNSTKKEIYNILQELFVFIQYHPETRLSEDLHNRLADFLDTFTDFGSGDRTLPNESI